MAKKITAQEFLEIEDRNSREIERLEREIDRARTRVKIPPRSKLRPATPRDFREGAVIYHSAGGNSLYWHVIDEVKYPNDDFKAYTADDGCRYGLSGAYVEA